MKEGIFDKVYDWMLRGEEGKSEARGQKGEDVDGDDWERRHDDVLNWKTVKSQHGQAWRREKPTGPR